MKLTNWLKGAAIALAAVGTVIPAPQLQAAQGNAPVKVETTKTSVLDISMSQDGVFAGRVVDHAGSPAVRAEVVISQGKKEVAKTTTDASGVFTVSGLKGGVYDVSSGNTVGQYRVWTESAAPEASKEQALLILGENGARGQFGAAGGGIVIIAAAVIASVIISAITLDRVNNVQEDVDKIPKSE